MKASVWTTLATLAVLAMAVAAVAAPVQALSGARLYVDPGSSAARAERSLRAAGRVADADEIDKIAAHPQATWFGGWNGADPRADVATVVRRAHAAGAVPVLVAYDIPGRDCGSYSAGGARSKNSYRRWIRGFARGLSGRAVVIVEPDAVPELPCLKPQRAALALLRFAVGTLVARRGAAVYIDAGNAGWVAPATIAARLRSVGVAHAAGFSLNVSNFDSTRSEIAYGRRIARLLPGKHFVVDTSRNGRGRAGGWCNPPGRALGQPATTATGDPLVDAFLWIKAPGESDGACHGGPPAGRWWTAYALGLARRAAF